MLAARVVTAYAARGGVPRRTRATSTTSTTETASFAWTRARCSEVGLRGRGREVRARVHRSAGAAPCACLCFFSDLGGGGSPEGFWKSAPRGALGLRGGVVGAGHTGCRRCRPECTRRLLVIKRCRRAAERAARPALCPTLPAPGLLGLLVTALRLVILRHFISGTSSGGGGWPDRCDALPDRVLMGPAGTGRRRADRPIGESKHCEARSARRARRLAGAAAGGGGARPGCAAGVVVPGAQPERAPHAVSRPAARRTCPPGPAPAVVGDGDGQGAMGSGSTPIP